MFFTFSLGRAASGNARACYLRSICADDAQVQAEVNLSKCRRAQIEAKGLYENARRTNNASAS
jgi:hypothetical protein